MKLLQKFKVLLLLSMAIVFANCSKNDPDNGYTPEVNPADKDVITISAKKYEVPKEGGDITVEIKSNINFEVKISESSKEWLKEAKTKAGQIVSNKLSFTVDANTDIEKREGQIIVKSNNLSDTIRVYQEGGDKSILLSESEYAIGEKGGIIKVELKSNCDYSVIMPDVHWIKESNTRAMSTHTLYFEITPNYDQTERAANIIFADTTAMVSDTLHIVQAKRGALLIAQEKYSMPVKGGEFDVEYNTTKECSIFIPPTNGWISAEEISVSGATSKKLHVKVEANEHNYNRTGIVVVKEVETNQADTVYVEQAADGKAVKISQKEFRISYEVTKVEFDITSEFKLTFDQRSHFAKEFGSHHFRSGYHMSNSVHYYNVSCEFKTNTARSERVGEIYILSQEDETPIDTVRIIQAPQEVIITSRNEYNISEKGGSFNIDYKTEFDYNITVSDSWISVKDVATRAFTDKKIQVDIAANTTSQDRMGRIVFARKYSNLTDTIYINQVSKGFINIPRKEYEVPEMQEEFDIEYSSNLDLIADVPTEYDWVDTVYFANGKAHVKLKAYKENSVREGFIILKEYTGAFSATVKVKQSGFDYYLDVPGQYEDTRSSWKYTGGLFSFTVLSNGPYKFEIEGIGEEPTWIHYVRTEKEGDDKFTELFYVDENLTDKRRACYIKVSLGNITRKYEFIQKEGRWLILSQTEYSVTADGGSYPLEIKAGGGEWAKEISSFYKINGIRSAGQLEPWLDLESHLVEGNGYDNAKIIVQPNLSEKTRTGIIFLEAIDSGVEQQIKVIQAGRVQ